MEEIIRLLRENNEMLREIIRYIKSTQTDKFDMNKSIKSFLINVCANIFSENLTENEKENIKKIMRNEKI